MSLRSVQELYGEKLGASDGEIGHVKDFYFDDKSWTLRYLVADTGGWLAGRRVLISPQALSHREPTEKVILVNLTRKQIEESPAIYEHEPVTRQQEEEYHRHYGYPYYAQSWPLWGLVDYPISPPLPELTAAEKSKLDSHLRSIRAMVGYTVEASDGAVGEVHDLLIDGATWVIGELVIKCGHWHAGKTIIIPTGKVSRISYADGAIYLDATKSAVMEASKATSSVSADL
ncbi:MAG: PRC-barrel domain-containing protein [Chthoniobacterales bacterium]